MSMCTDCWFHHAYMQYGPSIHIGCSFLPYLNSIPIGSAYAITIIFPAWPAILDIELICWSSHFGLWHNKTCHLLNQFNCVAAMNFTDTKMEGISIKLTWMSGKASLMENNSRCFSISSRSYSMIMWMTESSLKTLL